MNDNPSLRDYPLTTVAASFLAGFATGSGVSGAAVAATAALSKNPGVRRVAAVAWPLVRSKLGVQVRENVAGIAKDAFARARDAAKNSR